MASEKPSRPSKGLQKSKAPIDNEEAIAIAQHADAAQKTYGRGAPVRTKSVKDRKLRANLRALEAKNKQAALQAKNAELLLEHNPGLLEPEHELERTYKTRQDEIRDEVGIETAKKGFELKLEGLGPYDVAEYVRNGRGAASEVSMEPLEHLLIMMRRSFTCGEERPFGRPGLEGRETWVRTALERDHSRCEMAAQQSEVGRTIHFALA